MGSFRVTKPDGERLARDLDDSDAKRLAVSYYEQTGERAVLTPYEFDDQRGEYVLIGDASFEWPATDGEIADTQEYAELSKKELLAVAKAKHVDVPSKATKADIVAALEQATSDNP